MMSSLSTGEPPTPPSTRSTDSVTNDESGLRTPEAVSSRRVHTLVTQIHDSGYETPATAICDPSGDIHFFDRDFVTPPAVSSEESLFDVFDDCSESMLLEPENNNDLCPDCGESNSCTCSRTESSSTVCAATSTSNYVVDPNVCDSDTSGQSSSCRTSSLPIIIPRPFPGLHQERSALSNVENVVSSQERYAILHGLTNNRTHPGGYPSRFIQWWNRVPLSSPSGLQVIDEELPRTFPLATTGASRTVNRRNWRRRIVSDSSLDSSSDEDDSSSDEEDCLVHFEESTYGEDLPVSMSPARLGISGPTERDDCRGSQLPSGERQRSQSLNLPSCVGIGRELRRMSSEFEQRRDAERNAVVIQPRRNSISSILSFRKYS